MSDKKPLPAEGGEQPAKQHSDEPTIVFIGLKIVDIPFGVDEYKRLVARQNDLCKDMHSLEEVTPTLREDILEAETALRSARAADRLNEACIGECKNELVKITESGARGILREERLVREEFLRGKIYVYDNKTGTLISERGATAQEYAKGAEFRTVDGKPTTGMIDPPLDQLPPRARAQRLLEEDGKRTKKGAEAKPEDGKTGGPAVPTTPPAPTPRGNRGTRPVPTSIANPPSAASAGDPPL